MLRTARARDMSVETMFRGDVAIVKQTGMLWEGKETDSLDEAIRALLGTGNLKLVVDLGECVILGNRPLGILVKAWAEYAKRGGRVVSCGVGGAEKRFVKMDQWVENYTTADEAVRSFDKGPA